MTIQDKIDKVRDNVIDAASVYSQKLAGRYYLYVFENNCFEMYYGTDNFLHLTGVGTSLSPNQFYQLAKDGLLQSSQIKCNKRFPLSVALKKSANMIDLDKFISEGYFVIKDLVTDTYTYPYAITNIEQSVLIGLKSEDEVNVIYIPKSYRIKGNMFDKTTNEKLFEIHMILSKTDIKAKYDNVLYQEKVKISELPESIQEKIDDGLK
jgi:hypothetical protein